MEVNTSSFLTKVAIVWIILVVLYVVFGRFEFFVAVPPGLYNYLVASPRWVKAGFVVALFCVCSGSLALVLAGIWQLAVRH